MARTTTTTPATMRTEAAAPAAPATTTTPKARAAKGTAPKAPAKGTAPAKAKAPAAPAPAPKAPRTVVRWTAPATATAQDVAKAQAQYDAAVRRLENAKAAKAPANLLHRYTTRIPRYAARLDAVKAAAGTPKAPAKARAARTAKAS